MIDDLTALRLQLDWGADEALGSDPVDRFVSLRPSVHRVEAVRSIAAAVPAPSVENADSLDALHAALDSFAACPLRATATHTVRPSGSAAAAVVVIADAPGSDDDRAGMAFSGAAGATLDRVMASIGLTRERMLLTTLVPWRPPGNRPPTDSEIQACLPFVRRLLALVEPQAVMLLGAGPMLALTGQAGTIRQHRGRWLDVSRGDGETKLKGLPVLPLAQWLRDSGSKQQLWSDLLLLRNTLTTG